VGDLSSIGVVPQKCKLLSLGRDESFFIALKLCSTCPAKTAKFNAYGVQVLA
jgi:hypothetical protein